jgi:hypothetical protein
MAERPLFYVDFNELMEIDVVLLSQTDVTCTGLTSIWSKAFQSQFILMMSGKTASQTTWWLKAS